MNSDLNIFTADAGKFAVQVIVGCRFAHIELEVENPNMPALGYRRGRPSAAFEVVQETEEEPSSCPSCIVGRRPFYRMPTKRRDASTGAKRDVSR